MAYYFYKILSLLIESGIWKKLSMSAKVVYLSLYHHYNWKRRLCFPSITTISKESGVARRSIFNGIDELLKAGLVVRNKIPNPIGKDRNNYLLVHCLLLEIEELTKKSGKTPSATDALASAINALRSAPNALSLVQQMHPNYMNVNLVNITNSFNQPRKNKNKTTPLRWEKRPEHINKEIEKILGRENP